MATALVTFVASPYGVTVNRGDTNDPAASWYLNGAAFIRLTTTNDTSFPAIPQRWLQLTGGARGYRSTGPGNQLGRVEVVSNTLYGVVISGAAASNNVIENCLLRDTTDASAGVGLYLGSARATVRNCTLTGNGRYGLRLVGATFTSVTNNLITASGTGAWAVHVNTATAFSGMDYNLLWATNGATLSSLNATNYPTLTAWRSASGRDANSLERDPLFVDPAAGNYHLQSTAGSYHDGVFTTDLADSPGLDTGFGDVGLETTPNATPLHPTNTGKRNLGAYGGTEQASRTHSGRQLYLYAPIGGENYPVASGVITTRWTWVGTAWSGGDTLFLEYQNALTGFTNVPGGGAVAASGTQFLWDVAGLPRESGYQLRLTSNQDAGVTAGSTTTFSLGGKLILYVNDSSLLDDIWCTVIGNDANDGTATNRPKATIQSALTTHDLQPGDEIRIDTGSFNLTSDIVISAADGGVGANPVLFLGSQLGNGTVLNRGNTNGSTTVIDCQASGVKLQNLRLTGGARGFVHSTGISNTLVNCLIYSNASGARVTGTGTLFVVNSTIVDNTQAGINCTGATNSPTIVNTILWNVTNDLIAAQATYSNIKQGGSGTGNLSAPPQFVNAAANDYRLLGASPCIDAGTNISALVPATDLFGQSRIFAGRVDIGAHEQPWSVSLVASTNLVAETSATTATITVVRDGSFFRDLPVPLTITGSAGNGADYELVASSVTISNGATTATFNLQPIADTLLEGNETATFTLSTTNLYLLSSTNTATITIDESADVITTKTGPPTIGAVGELSYTLTVSNAGPATALDIALTDVLPAGVTFVATSAGGTHDAGVVTWPLIASLDSGSASNFTVTVAAPGDGTLTNLASSTAATTDPDTANNNGTSPAARAITTITEVADVITTKSGPASVNAIAEFTYTITVSNAGPSVASNVSVTDPLPPGVGFVIASGGGTNANGVIGWPPLPPLAAGNHLTLSLTVTAPAQGTLTNFIASSATTPDTNAANNDGSAPTAQVITTVIPRADVVTTKAGPATVNAGTELTYTITVTNAGPSIATQIAVTDPLPTTVNFLTASAGGTNDNGIVGWPLVAALPAGGLTNFTVTVAAPATGLLTNTVASGSAIFDPNASNNNGSEPAATVVTLVIEQADIITTKTGPATVMQGTNFTYTITVTNAGPSMAENVAVADLLPPLATFADASDGGTNANGLVGWPLLAVFPAGATTNFTVTVTAPTEAAILTNTIASTATTADPLPGNNNGTAPAASVLTTVIPEADIRTTKTGPASFNAGTNLTYTITVTNAGPSAATEIAVTDPLPSFSTFVAASAGGTNANGIVGWPFVGALPAGTHTNFTVTIHTPATGVLTNTATSTAATLDPNLANNDGTAITLIIEQADIRTTKAGPATVLIGTNFTYTIALTNAGPSTAIQVAVTDPLPPLVTFVDASAGGTNDNGVVGWPSLAELPAGATTNFTVTVTAPLAPATLTNISLSTAATADPLLTNNDGTAAEAQVTTTVVPYADILTTKSGPATILAGSNLTYTVTVTNAGPSVATAIATLDTLPTNVVFVSASDGGTNLNGVVGWPLVAELPAGGVTNFTVTVLTPGTGSLTNTVASSAVTFDPTLANNDGSAAEATVVTLILEQADIRTTKLGPAEVPTGSNFTYTITVTNAGPSTASDIAVVDTLPALTTFVSASDGGTNDNGLVGWPLLATLSVGDTTNFTVIVTAPVTPATLTNLVSSTSVTPDPNPVNNDASDSAARVITLANLLDSDSDGMPDVWELANGLNPADPADAALDADGDGQSNLAEYLAGTDPQDAGSLFAITAIFRINDDVHVRFPSVTGKQYLLQYRSSMETGSWTDVPPPIPGNDTELEVSDPDGALETGRYYRIRLVLPP
ncbi:MAG: hypothetical protein PCFJNLEI_03452 [Verrucomicrobiae bacterium]|nr:hypothetical protein [Verrucomicrobiae bacterium]